MITPTKRIPAHEETAAPPFSPFKKSRVTWNLKKKFDIFLVFAIVQSYKRSCVKLLHCLGPCWYVNSFLPTFLRFFEHGIATNQSDKESPPPIKWKLIQPRTYFLALQRVLTGTLRDRILFFLLAKSQTLSHKKCK